MNVIALHDRALDVLGTTIEKIDAAQLGDPTPCSEFDVRALLNHVIGGNLRFVAIAQGEPGASVPATGDFVTDDAVMPYRESAAALSKAWSDPAVLERTVQMPFGDFPGEFALGIHIVEAVVHTWDLSKATGQPTSSTPSCARRPGSARRTSTTASGGRAARSVRRLRRPPTQPRPSGWSPGSAADPDRLSAGRGRGRGRAGRR